MSRKRTGFTLMELIVVVAILAALAGLVINKVDWIRRQANMAIGAEASGDVARNIQTYIAATERLPSGLDSLMVSGGTSLYAGPSAANGLGGIIGITDGVGNIPTQTTIGSIAGTGTDRRLNSLFRLGMSFVNDHDTTSNASDSGTIQRVLGTTSSTGSVLTTAQPFVLVNTSATLSSIWA